MTTFTPRAEAPTIRIVDIAYLRFRIVGAPFLADSHVGQCIERLFCGSNAPNVPE